jgi:Taurine catabolism dioxygenase TauD, TfdA family
VLWVDARVRRPLLLTVTVARRHRDTVESPAVWRAIDVADTSEWTHTFTADQRAEIVTAARRSNARGATPSTLTREDFVMSGLARDVASWTDSLTNGRGFILLRNFPIDELSPDETELAYAGLGLQLGMPVSQDAFGSVLGHVRDERIPRDSPAVRLYRTNQRQDFHTDGADLVGLLCLERAKTGGESRITSSYALYNEMLDRRPDLIDVLYEPMYWDRNDEQSTGEPPFYALAPISDVNGTPRIFYIGWYIREAQRHPDTPRLTEAQCEAMDLLETIANNPDFYVEMDFQPGDIQLLNNARILHSREPYTDHDDPARRRHLLRLWLAAHEFVSVEDQLRQGIPQRH